MGVRVGVPRALWYYTYYPFWSAFFTEMGASLVLSRPTTKATLDAGVLDTVSEACVPIKLFFGHVRDLCARWQNGEIDVLFLPRYVNWEGRTVFCPKFLGLPDMVRHAYESLPPLLEVRIDRRGNPLALWRVCDQVRQRLGQGVLALWRAYRLAWRAQRTHERRLRENWRPPESIAGKRHSEAPSGQSGHQPIRLAVLAYPYLIYDSYISLGLLQKLESMAVEVVTAETLWAQGKLRRSREQKRLFWTYSDMVQGAGYYVFSPDCRGIDGVIHVTAFGCGPDAMVDKLLELESLKNPDRPFLSLCLDEQTGEAGCLTRLEAFVDMLRRRNRRWPR